MMNPVGIIGVGEIAGAIVDGLCDDPDTAPDVFLSPRNDAVAHGLAARHRSVRVCSGNQAVVDSARTVIIAVRPDDVADALDGLRVPDDRIVVSAVAGTSHESLRRFLGERPDVVRTIPLPAVRRRRGVTAVFPAHPEVQALFDRLGGTVVVDDAGALDAVQAVTATLSTHLHYLAAVTAWLDGRGVGADAETYVRSLFLGLADGLSDRTTALPDMAVAYETPGGINEQLRRTWFTEENSAALARTIDEIHARLTGRGDAGITT